MFEISFPFALYHFLLNSSTPWWSTIVYTLQIVSFSNWSSYLTVFMFFVKLFRPRKPLKHTRKKVIVLVILLAFLLVILIRKSIHSWNRGHCIVVASRLEANSDVTFRMVRRLHKPIKTLKELNFNVPKMTGVVGWNRNPRDSLGISDEWWHCLQKTEPSLPSNVTHWLECTPHWQQSKKRNKAHSVDSQGIVKVTRNSSSQETSNLYSHLFLEHLETQNWICVVTAVIGSGSLFLAAECVID